MLDDKKYAINILNSTFTLQEAAVELYNFARAGNYVAFMENAVVAHELLCSINKAMKTIAKEDEFLCKMNSSIIENTIYSLERIITYGKSRSLRMFERLNFEFLPMLNLFYFLFYYVALIEGDKEKEESFMKKEASDLLISQHLRDSFETGIYKYEVSICITGYNKLEYTKKCVESVLKHTPADLNYELILLNHGSDDGTKEYFESVGCTKQLDFVNNGIGIVSVYYAMEGKYYCSISNDVIVGPNYLSNMLQCIKSDPNIKFVVPATTNVSNFQSPDTYFKTLGEVEEYMSANNICDPYRWEQRVRLVDPIALYDLRYLIENEIVSRLLKRTRAIGFADDMISLLLRRQGKKAFLAKDAFCFHFGSVTLNEDKSYSSASNFEKGRLDFFKEYGIDPWGKGVCYSPELFKNLNIENYGHTDILGLNCGLGSNPLKIKELIKERKHNLDVHIDNITDESNYFQDLKGVSNEVLLVSNIESVFDVIEDKKYDYIIFEGDLDKLKNRKRFVDILKRTLKNEGTLIIFDNGSKYSNSTLSDFKNIKAGSNSYGIFLRKL